MSDSMNNDRRDDVVKRKVKDTVFSNLFSESQYVFELYRSLHPEDDQTTVDDITNVTLEKTIVDGQYNDLGMLVGNSLVVLMEAQSTWSENIILRLFFYASETYSNYLSDSNLFSSKRVKIPKAEFYVVYTGTRAERPDTLSLRESFFDGEECGIDIKVKVLYGGREKNVLNEYVEFTQIEREVVARLGRTREAAKEIIRICLERNVLVEYLKRKEKEVMDIMETFFNQERTFSLYVRDERREAEEKGVEKGREEGREEEREKNARTMLLKGKLSKEDVSLYTGLSLQRVEELAKRVSEGK